MLQLLHVIINYAVFAFLILLSFQSKLRFSKIASTLLIFSLGACSIIAALVISAHNHSYCPFTVSVITLWVISAALAAKLFVKEAFLQLFFLLLMCVNSFTNIEILSSILDRFIFGQTENEVRQLIVNLLLLAVHVPLLLLLLNTIFRTVLETAINLKFWKFAWVVPLLFHIVGILKILPDYADSPLPITLQDILVTVLWDITVHTVFCIVLYIIMQTGKTFAVAEQIHLMERQLEIQKNLHCEITKSFEKTERLRHDFHHHVLTISGYTKSGNLNALSDYLKTYFEEFSVKKKQTAATPLCLNIIVDNILRYYALAAEKQKTVFKTSVFIEPESGISDMDLSIIFGNLTENALEACARQEYGMRYITVLAEQKNQQLFITISNSFNGQIREKGGMYISSKRQAPGIGIASVIEVAEKNNGSVKIMHNAEIFTVQVYLSVK